MVLLLRETREVQLLRREPDIEKKNDPERRIPVKVEEMKKKSIRRVIGPILLNSVRTREGPITVEDRVEQYCMQLVGQTSEEFLRERSSRSLSAFVRLL